MDELKGGNMSYETLKRYISLCDMYGWPCTIAGLIAYDRQEKTGMRARMIGNAPKSTQDGPFEK